MMLRQHLLHQLEHKSSPLLRRAPSPRTRRRVCGPMQLMLPQVGPPVLLRSRRQQVAECRFETIHSVTRVSQQVLDRLHSQRALVMMVLLLHLLSLWLVAVHRPNLTCPLRRDCRLHHR